jgi:hypothetical protein
VRLREISVFNKSKYQKSNIKMTMQNSKFLEFDL